ncbi:MAG: M23 family metallopeptidase [bacterium]
MQIKNIPADFQNHIDKTGDQNLEKAAADFEAIFISKMLSEAMPEGGGENTLFGKSNARDIYKSMFYDAMAEEMAQSSPFGIKDMLLEKYSDSSQKEKVLPAELSAEKVRRPGPVMRNYRVTSSFGLRNDPFTGKLRFHRGIDLAAKEGEPVFSPISGKVIKSGEERGYGNCIRVLGRDGKTYIFAHLKHMTTEEGSMISKGEKLGSVGSSGRATGPHLHFEVRDRNNRSLNPADLFEFTENKYTRRSK